MRKGKSIACIFLSIAMLMFAFAGCGKEKKLPDARRGLDDFEFTRASITATDRYGRETTPVGAEKAEKYVGLFYWMWISNTHYYYHNIFDCTKLMSTEEGQAAFWNVDSSNAAYEKLSQVGAFHFTNEPMYGYYNSSDPWVITRHMELFMWAGIDYIFLDTSNDVIYDWDSADASRFDGTVKSPCYALLDTMLGLQQKGWEVPKVVFLTNTRSGDTVDKIYRAYYESGKYDSLWFRPNGADPMIIGTTENNDGASDAADRMEFVPIAGKYQLYFDVKETQWPNKANKDIGFPWLNTRSPQYYHSESMAMSVSVAQHGMLGFTDMMDRSNRGYDYTKYDVEEKWQMGRNFENQWQTVLNTEAQGKPVQFVQVTGWNEWIGQKFGNLDAKAVMVDNFYGPYSRDIEPDKTLYKDDTLMQLARNLRTYAYHAAAKKYLWNTKTVQSFADFDDVQAVYVDPVGDATARDYYGFDVRTASKEAGLAGAWYTDKTARNDITEVRTVHDKSNLYMLVTTAENITPYEGGDNWMNVLIKTNASTAQDSFEGYDYILNRNPSDGTTSIERSTGGYQWTETGKATYVVEGNKMMFTVPLSALGLTADSVEFAFKVADNVQKPSWYDESDPEYDIMYHYITGDSAPIGRFGYSYGY